MRFLFILCCLVAVQARIVRDECRGVSIDGNYYRKELVLKHFDRPYLLDVNKATNDLYFSYVLNDDNTDSLSVRLNLDLRTYYKIKGIEAGNSHAVDQVTGDVYIGAYDSIYKYKPRQTPIKIINSLHDNWASDIVFKDGVLYYTTYPEWKMYSYSKGSITHLSEFDGMAINYFKFKDADMFFSNFSGIYYMTPKETVLLRSTYEKEVQALSLDNFGKMYASLFDGLYVFDEDNMSMRKILDVPSSFGVAFDRDNNMIYSHESGLIRLLPIDQTKCSFIYK